MPKVSWKQKLKFGEGRREEGNEEEKNTSPVSNPAPLLRFPTSNGAYEWQHPKLKGDPLGTAYRLPS